MSFIRSKILVNRVFVRGTYLNIFNRIIGANITPDIVENMRLSWTRFFVNGISIKLNMSVFHIQHDMLFICFVFIHHKRECLTFDGVAFNADGVEAHFVGSFKIGSGFPIRVFVEHDFEILWHNTICSSFALFSYTINGNALLSMVLPSMRMGSRHILLDPSRSVPASQSGFLSNTILKSCDTEDLYRIYQKGASWIETIWIFGCFCHAPLNSRDWREIRLNLFEEGGE